MISVKEATKNYINGGKGKTTMPLGRMFVLAFLAGMFIALAGTAATIASSTVTNSSVAKVITSLVFPAGLAMVIINGTELFTGNNLLIMSVLSKNITVGQMLKNWIVVYIGNFVGSIFVTGFFTLGNIYSMFNSSVAKSVISIATTKCNLSIQEMFFRAILCNILVCVAVMMAATSKTVGGKIIGLFLPIMVFVICGFEHSVANMSYISGGLFSKMAYGNLGLETAGLTWFNFIVKNLLVVTIGNIIGGCATGIAYWISYYRKQD